MTFAPLSWPGIAPQSPSVSHLPLPFEQAASLALLRTPQATPALATAIESDGGQALATGLASKDLILRVLCVNQNSLRMWRTKGEYGKTIPIRTTSPGVHVSMVAIARYGLARRASSRIG